MAFDEKFFKLLTDFWFFNPQLSNTVLLFLKIMNENINIYQLSFFLHHNLISRFLYDNYRQVTSNFLLYIHTQEHMAFFNFF